MSRAKFIILIFLLSNINSYDQFVQCDVDSACPEKSKCCPHGKGYRCCLNIFYCCNIGEVCCSEPDKKGFLDIIMKSEESIKLINTNDKLLIILNSFLESSQFNNYDLQQSKCKNEIKNSNFLKQIEYNFDNISQLVELAKLCLNEIKRINIYFDLKTNIQDIINSYYQIHQYVKLNNYFEIGKSLGILFDKLVTIN